MKRVIQAALQSVVFGVFLILAAQAPAADGLRDRDHELNADFPKDLSGEEIVLKTAGGVSFNAYVSGPSDASRGILLIHEWWGLNDHIRAWADRFAALGYRALAVDLYDGKVATAPAEARRYLQSVEQDEANAKHRAALGYLKAPGRKLATIGWCFGGGQSLQASLAAAGDVDATVIYYGSLVTDAKTLSALRAPVLGIFARRDAGITVEKVKAFEAAMEQVGKTLEVHFYDADHAFANPSGDRYDGDAARAAWKVTRAFLDRRLK